MLHHACETPTGIRQRGIGTPFKVERRANLPVGLGSVYNTLNEQLHRLFPASLFRCTLRKLTARSKVVRLPEDDILYKIHDLNTYRNAHLSLKNFRCRAPLGCPIVWSSYVVTIYGATNDGICDVCPSSTNAECPWKIA